MAKRDPITEAFAAGLAEGLPVRNGEIIAPIKTQASTFDAGANNDGPHAAWSSYDGGYYQPSIFGGATPVGGRLTRDGRRVSRVAVDAAHSATIATLVETLTTNAVGAGLTFSSKIDAEQAGITKEEARALSSVIEREWNDYASDPANDLTGRFSVHQIVACAYAHWLITGEALLTLDWLRTPGTMYRTKVSLLDSAQLDTTRSGRQEGDGAYTWQGVTFNASGRVVGYWIVPQKVGDSISVNQAVFVPAFTNWGRPKVVHVMNMRDPQQVRGLSTLHAALTPAQAHRKLEEYTLEAAYNQAAIAWTVESSIPGAAINGLASEDVRSGVGPAAGDLMRGMIADRADYYSKRRVSVKPGTVAHLMPGDKLERHSSEHPNSTYEAFSRDLRRSAAAAAGSTYSEMTGDYERESFSSSRMASERPHRINMKRRQFIAATIYKAIFRAWLEEAISIGVIKLPKEAVPFWQRPGVYCKGNWLGSGRPQPDQKKYTEAAVLAVTNNMATLEQVLAENGQDLETVIRQRAYEQQLLAENGLTMADVIRTPAAAEDDEDDTPANRRGGR